MMQLLLLFNQKIVFFPIYLFLRSQYVLTSNTHMETIRGGCCLGPHRPTPRLSSRPIPSRLEALLLFSLSTKLNFWSLSTFKGKRRMSEDHHACIIPLLLMLCVQKHCLSQSRLFFKRTFVSVKRQLMNSNFRKGHICLVSLSSKFH